MSDDLLKYLAEKIAVEMRRVEQDMVMGNAKDFAAYQHACGVYRGLLYANNIISETAERMETAND
jgi:hypothetical protein